MEVNPYNFTVSITKTGPAMWSVPPHTYMQLAKPNNWYPVQVLHVNAKAKATENVYSRQVGSKAYELSDHLGNVTVTVSDLKRELPNLQLATYGISTLSSTEVAYAAQVLSYTNYYAFGMSMPGRNKTSEAYRYGFNGHEKSDEIALGHTTAEFWEYDSRSGRRWNVDPAFAKYPEYSPYSAYANNPIIYIDMNGDTIKIVGNNSFKWKTALELTIISASKSKTAKRLLQYLGSAKRYINIKSVKSTGLLAFWKELNNEWTVKEITKSTQTYDTPRSVNIEIDQQDGTLIDKRTFNTYEVLIHEFVHAKDFESGFHAKLRRQISNYSVEKDIMEIRAMLLSNIISMEMGENNIRTEYQGVKLLKDDGITPVKKYYDKDGKEIDITKDLLEFSKSANSDIIQNK